MYFITVFSLKKLSMYKQVYQASQFCFVFSAERLCVMFLLYRLYVFEHVNALERKRERMSERREREGMDITR